MFQFCPVPIIGESHCSASLGKSMPRCWKGGYD
uniref:Uncharacterized protein n=1 Tax=Anguilla anguilla TaxID=7936 RepID=A0A0E9T0A8_ANGAN